MKLLLIDEQNCFDLIQQEVSEHLCVEVLEPEYYVAPNPDFFEKMVERASATDLVIIHRAIWTDECDLGETCLRLDEFVKRIKPIPVLRVGKPDTNHESCPHELLDVYRQIVVASQRLSSFINRKVKPANSAWRHTEYLIIESLEMIGENKVGCALRIPESGGVTKYYHLADLQPA